MEIDDPIEVGQTYYDHTEPSAAEVTQIFVDEDGETQIRVEIEKSRRDQSKVLVDKFTFVERVSNGELELLERPPYREA